MKTLLRTQSLLWIVMIIGCDPGMMIHEISPASRKSASTAPAQVIIQINATHQLIGERWYAPRITFINHSMSKITVTRAELSTSLGLYPNNPRPDAYPVEVAQGEAKVLEMNFQLANDVKKTFQHAAEVRVYFRTGDREEVITKSVIGGSLGSKS